MDDSLKPLVVAQLVPIMLLVLFTLYTKKSRKALDPTFFRTLFSLMGKLAKADGNICDQEAAHTNKCLQRIGLTSKDRQEAVIFFALGAKPDYPIDHVLDKFKQKCGQDEKLKQILIIFLLEAALADNDLHSSEINLLLHIADQLGDDITLQVAYYLLGTKKSDTDAEIKTAYRRLKSKYHPDRLIGQGETEENIKEAKQRLQEFQIAYKIIQNSRNEASNISQDNFNA